MTLHKWDARFVAVKDVILNSHRIKTLEQMLIDLYMTDPCLPIPGTPWAEAKELLTELGYLTPNGNLTPEGIARRDEE